MLIIIIAVKAPLIGWATSIWFKLETSDCEFHFKTMCASKPKKMCKKTNTYLQKKLAGVWFQCVSLFFINPLFWKACPTIEISSLCLGLKCTRTAATDCQAAFNLRGKFKHAPCERWPGPQKRHLSFVLWTRCLAAVAALWKTLLCTQGN